MATVETLRAKLPKTRVILCKVALLPLFAYFVVLALFGWNQRKEAHLHNIVDAMAKWIADGVKV